MADTKMIKVTNRDSGSVGYTIPEKNIRRVFSPNETKLISEDELQSLQYVPGGDFILRNLIIVQDKEVLEEKLNIQTEPEYFYTEEQVVEILKNGTLDQLLDMLDFAPEGVIEIAKNKAVELKLSDTDKRDAISKKTGFNIDNAINVNKIMNADLENDGTKPATEKVRRTAPLKTDEQPKRRTTPKYNVVK
jgi:hypothetical protein